MSDFNYKQWLTENKVGPYLKETLHESESQQYAVLAKSRNSLVAYPSSEGGYSRRELETWIRKGHEAGQVRKIDWTKTKDQAIELAKDLQEDTYPETYEDDGPENPHPEDEQFRESMYDLYINPGETNSAIAHYSNGELDADNDTMPANYSVPNPGLGADKNAAWKPKPFNNGKADYSEPHKYGW